MYSVSVDFVFYIFLIFETCSVNQKELKLIWYCFYFIFLLSFFFFSIVIHWFSYKYKRIDALQKNLWIVLSFFLALVRFSSIRICECRTVCACVCHSFASQHFNWHCRSFLRLFILFQLFCFHSSRLWNDPWWSATISHNKIPNFQWQTVNPYNLSNKLFIDKFPLTILTVEYKWL